MNIPEMGQKIKSRLEGGLSEWGIVAIVILTGSASFGLGRLSALEEVLPPVAITGGSMTASAAALPLGGMFVAARTGSVYYYPWCGGAQNIKQNDQVWFRSEDAARKAGYRPAKNCKGL